jgi:hypothetical protein
MEGNRDWKWRKIRLMPRTEGFKTVWLEYVLAGPGIQECVEDLRI